MPGYKIEIKTELNYWMERYTNELKMKQKLEKVCSKMRK